MDYLEKLFSSAGFMPHGFCYLWSPALLWTLVVSEAVISLAYFSIPFALMVFAGRRKDLRFNSIYQLFSLFIFACGITHLLGIWTIWHPDYWLDALAKALTASASLVAAAVLWNLVPRALKLPSTKQLEELVAILEQEVAQRKYTEAELIRLKSVSDERFRILFESTRDALVILTPDGVCLDGNPAALEMYECADTSELMTKTPVSFAPVFQPDGRRSDEKAREMIRLTMEKGSHLFEWTHKKKNGAEYTVEALLTRIRFGGETVLVSNARDISERKQTELALLEAKQIAEKSTRLKSEFLANMSHEIRNPMNAIFGLSELILNQDISPQVRGYMEKIRKASDSQLSIINDILDFSKIESRYLEIEKTSFNLDDMAANLSNLFLHAAGDKQLTLTIRVMPDAPRQLLGDAMRIQQILTNLLSNAIKFTEQGSVLLLIKCLNATDTHAVLEFAVEDTGIGMSEADLTKLFQPFVQANSTITRRFGGTGLGLAISQSLLRLMGSEFQVTSAPGMGSIFRFTLTLEKCRDTGNDDHALEKSRRAGLLSQKLQAAGKKLAGIRVLVAEDNQTNQFIIKDMLGLCGIEAEIANNGKEALSMLAAKRFDAVLMDVHMPEMHGMEATRLIRGQSRFADLPIIALTADVTLMERENYLAGGFNDLIIKPFRPEILIDTLNRSLKR